MLIRWANSAKRHGVSRVRSAHVVWNAHTILAVPAPQDSPLKDRRLMFLGTDSRGVLLEVMAVEIPEGMLVIHAMPIRERYLQYMESDDD